MTAAESPPVRATMEADGTRLRCDRCGIDTLVLLPLEAGAVLRRLKRFAREHRTCERETAE